MLQGFCVRAWHFFCINFFWIIPILLLKKLKMLSPNDAPEVRCVTSSQQPSPSTSGLQNYVSFITQQRVRFATLFKIALMRSFDSLDGLYWWISVIYDRKVQIKACFIGATAKRWAPVSWPPTDPHPPLLLTPLKFTGNNNEIKLYIKADLPNEEIIFKYCTECIYAYIARISRAINFHMRYIVCTFIERHFTKKKSHLRFWRAKKSIERGKYFTILTINIFTETLRILGLFTFRRKHNYR